MELISCGKSGFSETLELALTGDTYRWKRKKNSAWKQDRRNLYDGEPCAIRIELAEEGVGQKRSVSTGRRARSWRNARHGCSVRAGSAAGNASLGWGRAVELDQLILSYDPLGGRLSDVLKCSTRLGHTAKDAQRDLRKDLTHLDDERAALALAELSKHRPSVKVVEEITTGASVAPTGNLASLKPDTAPIAPSAGGVRSCAKPLTSTNTAVTARVRCAAKGRRWSAQPDDDQLAEYLETAYDNLAAAFELLSDEARRVCQENQDRWSPEARSAS